MDQFHDAMHHAGKGNMLRLTSDQALLVELAKAATAQAAPEELGLFEETVLDYFHHLARPAGTHEPGDGRFGDPMGFGLDLSLPALTTAALACSFSTLSFLGFQVKGALEEESGSVIRAWVKRLFRVLRPPDSGESLLSAPPANVPQFSAEQLARIREIAYDRAIAMRVSENKAEIIADAIVGRLGLPAKK